jgi:hypothetical protein
MSLESFQFLSKATETFQENTCDIITRWLWPYLYRTLKNNGHFVWVRESGGLGGSHLVRRSVPFLSFDEPSSPIRLEEPGRPALRHAQRMAPYDRCVLSRSSRTGSKTVCFFLLIQ